MIDPKLEKILDLALISVLPEFQKQSSILIQVNVDDLFEDHFGQKHLLDWLNAQMTWEYFTHNQVHLKSQIFIDYRAKLDQQYDCVRLFFIDKDNIFFASPDRDPMP